MGAACGEVEEGLAGEAGGFGELVVGHAGVGLVHLERVGQAGHVGFGWGVHSRYATGATRFRQHKMLYRMCVRCQDDPDPDLRGPSFATMKGPPCPATTAPSPQAHSSH